MRALSAGSQPATARGPCDCTSLLCRCEVSQQAPHHLQEAGDSVGTPTSGFSSPAYAGGLYTHTPDMHCGGVAPRPPMTMCTTRTLADTAVHVRAHQPPAIPAAACLMVAWYVPATTHKKGRTDHQPTPEQPHHVHTVSSAPQPRQARYRHSPAGWLHLGQGQMYIPVHTFVHT
jgi:hypothetical protein